MKKIQNLKTTKILKINYKHNSLINNTLFSLND